MVEKVFCGYAGQGRHELGEGGESLVPQSRDLEGQAVAHGDDGVGGCREGCFLLGGGCGEDVGEVGFPVKHPFGHALGFTDVVGVEFAEISAFEEWRFVGQNVQQGISQFRNPAEVESGGIGGYASSLNGSWGGNGDGFLPGGDGDVALFVDSDASFFQFFQDMDSMELEDEEGVVVDFESDHIDHGGNVLAGYGPVGAIAAHGEVAP